MRRVPHRWPPGKFEIVRLRRCRERGFSLLEVLIAMFVLSIGAASVLALFAAAASTHKRSVDRTHAALIAERLFSEVQARYAPGADEGELEKELVEELPKTFGAYGWKVELVRPAAKKRRGLRESSTESPTTGGSVWTEDELYVSVHISWKQKAQARTESFFTILLPRNVSP